LSFLAALKGYKIIASNARQQDVQTLGRLLGLVFGAVR